MIYRLGIITQDEVPFVIMEALDDDGVTTGEKEEAKTINVQGTLMSNKENQLILVTKNFKKVVIEPGDLPKNE